MFIYPIYNHNWRNISIIYITRLAAKEILSPSNKIHREVGRAKDLSAHLYSTGVRISPQSDQEGNKLQRQKILSFIYPIYDHNWWNISTTYIYIYIYLLTPWSRVLLEKLTGSAASQEIPRIFGTRRFITVIYIYIYIYIYM